MSDKIISIMLQNTYTSDDLVKRLGWLRVFYSEHLFNGKGEDSLKTILGKECEEENIQVLQEWIDDFKKNNLLEHEVYEAINEIEKKVSTLETITLYVPIKFSHQYIARFGKWFRENVQRDTLLTLRTNPEVSGGCGVVFNDVYHDFSLRYFIKKSRAELINMFNKHSHDK